MSNVFDYEVFYSGDLAFVTVSMPEKTLEDIDEALDSFLLRIDCREAFILMAVEYALVSLRAETMGMNLREE